MQKQNKKTFGPRTAMALNLKRISSYSRLGVIDSEGLLTLLYAVRVLCTCSRYMWVDTAGPYWS